MFYTEADIARCLEGKFYQLQQKSLGSFQVVDLNEVEEDEAPLLPSTRWTDQELTYLVELKRQGKTHAQCGELLGRTDAAVMDKWQNRMAWSSRVHVPRKEHHLWMEEICRVCCGVFGVSRHEFMSHRRSYYMVDARQVFYWLCREYTEFSLPQIGLFTGGRDHSTVLHGVKKVDQQLDRYRTKIEMCLFDLGLSLPTQEAA